MKRILEPELMEDDEQALAYAEADFESPHSHFVAVFRETFPGLDVDGHVLDMGCGPGDISMRFARAFPKCVVHGVDGAAAMLDQGRRVLAHRPELQNRVTLFQGVLPGAVLPRSKYEVLISNSLLHHLHDPQVLWNAVRSYAASGAPVFVMDLKRPASVEEARRLVRLYTSGEPAVLKRDFFNSLLAAFEPEEIVKQLEAARLDRLAVRVVSDRHVVVSGCVG